MVSQTCEQASQFGIAHCTSDGDLPIDFYEGNSILITSVQKLFNGLTKFDIGAKSEPVGAIVLDDAHACVDAIRDAVQIHLKRTSDVYQRLIRLFSESLREQGAGTFQEIINGESGSQLLIPYWSWQDKQKEVVEIIGSNNARGSNAIKFAWPLLKDRLDECQCLVSGQSMEISPYLPPLDLFGSYHQAEHRIFMSATIAEDAFLVKGLGLSAETIQKPLTREDDGWSGERMVLIPSLIDPSLSREDLVEALGPSKQHRSSGVVVLTPSFKRTRDWEKYGASVADTDTIDQEVTRLRQGEYADTLVTANRYDGIDLPDDACRILVLDSAPYAQSLIDRYEEECRSESKVILGRRARKIEQGMGRSVRGEKDYCVLMLIGPDLVKSVRLQRTRDHLSPQTRKEIEVGLQVASWAKDDVQSGTSPRDALGGLISQCLSRDGGWKKYYAEQMESVVKPSVDTDVLSVFEIEHHAERLHANGDVEGAVDMIQRLIDNHVDSDNDRGWYLQRMARYLSQSNPTRSNKLQLAAHNKNRYLLKPRDGFKIEQLKVNQRRVEGISSWVRGYESYSELSIELDSILSRLEFGVDSDRFEEALNDVARAIGFSAERPDKEWKEGPDNLWALSEGQYLLVECKNEVNTDRADINKGEAEQMNRSCAWFKRHYTKSSAINLLIHPSYKVNSAAALIDEVEVMCVKELQEWKERVRAFFQEFRSTDLENFDEKRIQKQLVAHCLDVDQLLKDCTNQPYPLGQSKTG